MKKRDIVLTAASNFENAYPRGPIRYVIKYQNCLHHAENISIHIPVLHKYYHRIALLFATRLRAAEVTGIIPESRHHWTYCISRNITGISIAIKVFRILRKREKDGDYSFLVPEI